MSLSRILALFLAAVLLAGCRAETELRALDTATAEPESDTDVPSTEASAELAAEREADETWRWKLGASTNSVLVLGIRELEAERTELVVTDFLGRVQSRWVPPTDPAWPDAEIVRIHPVSPGRVFVVLGIGGDARRHGWWGGIDYETPVAVWRGNVVDNTWERVLHTADSGELVMDADGETLPITVYDGRFDGGSIVPWGWGGQRVLLLAWDGECGDIYDRPSLWGLDLTGEGAHRPRGGAGHGPSGRGRRAGPLEPGQARAVLQPRLDRHGPGGERAADPLSHSPPHGPRRRGSPRAARRAAAGRTR